MSATHSPRTAVLVCDIQNGILEQQFAKDETALQAYLTRVNAVISEARAQGLLLIFVRVAFRPGHPEASENNKVFKIVKANNLMVDRTESTKLHSMLDVQENDIVLTKCRFGVFSNTALRTILQAHEINTLVLSGVSTSGVILTTVCEGFDMDLRVVVLSDAVYDSNANAHASLLKDVFPRRADVMTSEEWSSWTSTKTK